MKTYLAIFSIGCMLLLSSCLTRKKVVYVNDMVPDTTYSAMEAPALRIQKGDRLSIVVGAKSPELAVPFNHGVGNYEVNETGKLSSSSTSISTKGYLVDDNGLIEFPILGALKVQGMTLDQTKNLVKNRLEGDKLIGEPTVSVELLNLKINMMGEIGSKGVLNVPDARITLLEAISRSGGLTKNAATDRITVIREVDGERKMVLNNIETIDIFDSPTYYLQQNDIVYVEPRDAELSIKEQNTWRYLGTGIGLLGSIFSILNFLK